MPLVSRLPGDDGLNVRDGHGVERGHRGVAESLDDEVHPESELPGGDRGTAVEAAAEMRSVTPKRIVTFEASCRGTPMNPSMGSAGGSRRER